MPSNISETFSLIIGGLVSTILLRVFMTKLTDTAAPARLEGPYKVVGYSRGIFAFLYFGVFFFVACSVLAPFNVSFQIFFLSGAAMSLYIVVGMNKTRVLFNSEQVRGPDMRGTPHAYKWSELKGVEYVACVQKLKLDGPDGGSIWVPVMSGFAEFQEELEKQCGHLLQNTAQ